MVTDFKNSRILSQKYCKHLPKEKQRKPYLLNCLHSILIIKLGKNEPLNANC